MQDDVNQKISMFIDDELSYNDSQALLKRIKSDDSLKSIMLRYQAVSHALKAEEYRKLKPDFSEKISQQIRQEATYLLPQKHSANLSRHKKLLAIAASSLVAAVLVGETIKNQKNISSSQSLSITASSPSSTQFTPSKQTPVTLAQQGQTKSTGSQPMTKEFNDYLQAHNGSVYMNGGVGMRSYAKVAAYGQE